MSLEDKIKGIFVQPSENLTWEKVVGHPVKDFKRVTTNIFGGFWEYNVLDPNERLSRYLLRWGVLGLSALSLYMNGPNFGSLLLASYGITDWGMETIYTKLTEIETQKPFEDSVPPILGLIKNMFTAVEDQFSSNKINEKTVYKAYRAMQRKNIDVSLDYVTHVGNIFRKKQFSKASGFQIIKKAREYLPLQKFFEKKTKKDLDLYMPDTPLGYIRDGNFFKREIREMSITTGGVQLIVARFLNLKKQKRTSEEINDELEVLYNKISYLEQILKNTPTFGAEFSFNGTTVKKTNPEYDFFKAKELANELLVLGGNSGNGIRPCDETTFTTMEFRINPSYAPMTIALIKEMFELGVFPSEELSWYVVNMVGKDVLENGIPLILTNYYTGLTPNLEIGAGENLEDVLDFKDVHVYQGATVDVKTGELLVGTKQLNIFAGVTGKIRKNKDLVEYKEILEEDPKKRMLRMLVPFLINKEHRCLWSEHMYQIFELNQASKLLLQRKFNKAEFDSNVWKTNKDIQVKDSAVIRERLHDLYSSIVKLVQTEKPEIYNALNIKL